MMLLNGFFPEKKISADIREKKAALLRTTSLVADRSFLHEVSVGRPWTTLVMQVSQAALADKCFSAEQVIKKWRRWLRKSYWITCP
ncbi:hypothetical protein HPP92_011467 [Vanilla planifolia]|uniref:Uncharacterized protein n=1 Tax=Vanilla planifolia TaxID=51239 RepID=A0A835UYG9_VANPL|nr:hypothetical protein HPP92_011467 [Vanilla planifolia]